MEKTTLTAEEVWSQHVEDAEQYGTPRKQIIHAMEEYASLLLKEKDREIEGLKFHISQVKKFVNNTPNEVVEGLNIVIKRQESELTRLKDQADRMASLGESLLNSLTDLREDGCFWLRVKLTDKEKLESALKEYGGND